MGLELLWLLGALALLGGGFARTRRLAGTTGSLQQLRTLALTLQMTPCGSGDGWVGQIRGYPLQLRLDPETGTARFRLRAPIGALRLRRRSWTDVLASRIRTGDPGFDRWVCIDHVPPGVRACLELKLRSRIRLLVQQADLSLRRGTWRGQIAPDRLEETLNDVVGVIDALQGADVDIADRLQHQALSDPDRPVRLRAVQLLSTRDEPRARRALEELVEAHPDWLGRWRAAQHLEQVPAMVRLALEAEEIRSCWQILRTQHRQRALRTLLQTIPAPHATAWLLRHLRGIARLVERGDPLPEVVALAVPETIASQRVADALVWALAPSRTRSAARIVAELLPHISEASWREAAGLLQHDPHALAPARLQALRSARPLWSDTIEELLQAAAGWRKAEELAQLLGLTVVPGRPLELVGHRQGLQLQIQLTHAPVVRLMGVPPDVTLSFDRSFGRRDPLTASWHHPKVRHALIVLQVITQGGVKDGTIWFRSIDQAAALRRGIEAALQLARALMALPSTIEARLVMAIRDERDAETRLRLLQALIHHGWPNEEGLETRLLADPDLRIRITLATELRRLPILAELAATPGLPGAVRQRALAGLWGEPALIPAALAAMEAGLRPADPDCAWLLREIAAHPSAEAQPLLIEGLKTPRARLRRAVIAALGQVGTAEAVPALREIADHWLRSGASGDAEAALVAIGQRLGATPGALSIAATSASGGLSEVD